MSGIAIPLLAVLVMTGCSVEHFDEGPARHRTKVIELDKSEIVRVALKMGAGELSVAGGSEKLLDGAFDFPGSIDPLVSYHSTGVRGDLTIEEPSNTGSFRHGEYKWDLRLNNRIPMDVITHLGAGQARLNLGELTLRSVEVHMGVGELTLDLRSARSEAPARDFDVSIHGGVGQATVYLPSNAAISATAQGGIGNISVEGLEKRNGRWINPTHEHAASTIHLEIKGGVGEIRLIKG